MKQQDEVQVIYLKARASSSSEAWSYIDRFDAEAGPAFDGRDDVSLDWRWWRFSPTAFITYAASSDEAMSACRAAVDAVLTDLRVDFPCKRFKAGMKRDFNAGKGSMIGFRDFEPVDMYAHVLEKFSDFQTVAFRPDAHHLVQRRLDFDPAADKARRNAARQVMTLEHKNIFALVREHQCGGKPRERAADHDDIIVIFVEFHAGLPDPHRFAECGSSFLDD